MFIGYGMYNVSFYYSYNRKWCVLSLDIEILTTLASGFLPSCCCCCCWVTSVMSDSVRPHRRQPTRLPHPWDSPGKNTGVGCHFLLQCVKVKSESEVAQSCPSPRDPLDCSLPGSSVHGIFPGKSTGVGCHCLPSYHQAILWHQLDILRLNHIRHHIHRDSLSSQSLSPTRVSLPPLLLMPTTYPGGHLCFWPTSYRLEVLTTPSLGLIDLLEWLQNSGNQFAY